MGAAILLVACSPSVDEAQLAEHRNLGKAFYENPVTQQEAVSEFRKALDLAPDSTRERLNYGLALLRAGNEDEAAEQLEQVQEREPSLPHTWFNLGLLHKSRGEFDQAVAQFEGFVERAPEEAVGHYQLGSLYQELGRDEEARAQYEQAAELDPLLAAPHFRLFPIYRAAGDAERARQHLAEFQRIQELQADWVTPEDVAWSDYAEIYDPPAQRKLAVDPPEPTFADQALSGSIDAATAGLALIDVSGQGRTDLLAWSSQGIRLYQRGSEPMTGTGLEALSSVLYVAPGDFDDDGLMDLAVLTAEGAALYRNNGGSFSRLDAALPAGPFRTAVWLDYDHDNDLDLFLLGDQGVLLRNQGEAGWEDRSADFPFVAGQATAAVKLRVNEDSTAFDLAAYFEDRDPVVYLDRLGGRYEAAPFDRDVRVDPKQIEADFNADGLVDRARVDDDGSIHLLRNQSVTSRNWISVQLSGVRSPKLAQDALVEVKAGELYRSKFYRGVPLHFDVADATTVDVVRITWPNGLIQNEISQAANHAYSYEEQQRLSGSCPMIWTWDGKQFRFITDVLGVAPLGASDGEGSYFAVDHDEYVQIPGEALQPRGGAYEVRITEELSEVAYLDQIELYAIDHPEGTDVFSNDKFKAPPFPEFRLFGVETRIYPVSAKDHKARDVLDRILARDTRYPDGFFRTSRGVAEPHYLELEFPDETPSSAVLFLNGWVDWPDGSTFRAVSQESNHSLVVPYLQVQDAQGRWVTVNDDMGMPAGKPKTISVPFEFLSRSRRLRIATSLSVYWDEVFLADDSTSVPIKQTAAPLISAALRFRGFSQSKIHPERKQPDIFFYSTFSSTSFWNPTSGLYTRYGSVQQLLERVDDRLVIMGSGDEVVLQFRELAAPPAGWRRDYLLKADGWAKDSDPNTAYSRSVEPLPFHGMSRYPYPAGEQYPQDDFHNGYRREFNTRPALVLIRPLDPGRKPQ